MPSFKNCTRNYKRIFVSSLPAMGWTGDTFTNYRCWYIAVFPPALLIIISIMALSVIIMVCVLYLIVLHSAVRTVDRIRDFQESHAISYINEAFECHKNNSCVETSTTTVNITISSQPITENCKKPVETHDGITTSTTSINKFKKLRGNITKIARYLGRSVSINSHPSKFKAVQTVLLILLCFVGTWTPYYIAIIMYVKCDIVKNGYTCVPLEVLTLGPLYMLGVSNSICDPLIYAWRHTGFKSTMKRMYRKFMWDTKIFPL